MFGKRYGRKSTTRAIDPKVCLTPEEYADFLALRGGNGAISKRHPGENEKQLADRARKVILKLYPESEVEIER